MDQTLYALHDLDYWLSICVEARADLLQYLAVVVRVHEFVVAIVIGFGPVETSGLLILFEVNLLICGLLFNQSLLHAQSFGTDDLLSFLFSKRDCKLLALF